jgi:hypothetical protein
MILSVDRDNEVQSLADIVGFTDIRSSFSCARFNSFIDWANFMGKAPAMMASTVGVAFKI